jgi:hypothetical protein
MKPLTLIEQAWFICMGMNIKANCSQDLFFLCGLIVYSTPFVFFHDGAENSFCDFSTSDSLQPQQLQHGYIYIISSTFYRGSHPYNVARFESDQNRALKQCIVHL